MGKGETLFQTSNSKDLLQSAGVCAQTFLWAVFLAALFQNIEGVFFFNIFSVTLKMCNFNYSLLGLDSFIVQ